MTSRIRPREAVPAEPGGVARLVPRARVGWPDPVPEATAEPDLSAPGWYLNRELTWLAFNRRVLHEACDERTPLLERVKFLAIVGSNSDEFVMKRMGGLRQQAAAGLRERTLDGRSPEEQIALCWRALREIQERERELVGELTARLGEHDVVVTRPAELPARDREWLREHYTRNIFPLVTPQAVDPAHPFPFISNLSLNLLIAAHHRRGERRLLTRVKVPVGAGIPRLVRVRDQLCFVPLEEVMAEHLDLLLPGVEVESTSLFRVTRNANTERDEENADDLLAMIETELRERKFAPIVRLEVARGMPELLRGMLAAELELVDEEDVVEVDGMLGTRDLMELAGLDLPELHDPPHRPIDHPRLVSDRNVFHILRDAGSILIQHPYESFSSSVERFLREAAVDPKVRALKMTLYRTSEDTNVVDLLIQAAQNGKQVTVVVELKARFDEDANIRWANRLEEAGIHVTYGVVGLKTHCKVILVVRTDYNGLRRYAHIGTGNYHAGNARLYADLGLLTADDAIGQDLTELFNYLSTGYKPKRTYRKIVPAPTHLKRMLLAKIHREAELHREDAPGRIQMKVNALEDGDVTRALYEAARAGVRVDLIVRDTCRLRPGVPGLTETVRVVGIVGRFLEHARVFHFGGGGEEEYYLGSADCMNRNLESRVEVVVPVEDERLRADLRFLLDAQLADCRSAWEMQADGTWVQRVPDDPRRDKSSQQVLIERAEKRLRDAMRLRRRSIKGLSRRSAT